MNTEMWQKRNEKRGTILVILCIHYAYKYVQYVNIEQQRQPTDMIQKGKNGIDIELDM